MKALRLFSTITIALIINSVASLNKHLTSELQSSAVKSIMNKAGKTPLIESFGFTRDLTASNFGLALKFSLDANIGYEFPASYLNNAGNHALFEPKIYVEGASNNYIEIFFGIYSFRFNFNFVGARYNLLEITYLWSIDDYT